MSVKKKDNPYKDFCFDWDDYVSLKEYFEEKINHMEESMDFKINSLKEATVLARESMDERLARMNEFRDALKDQNASFTTKTEHELLIKRIDDKIENLRAEIKSLSDKTETSLRDLAKSRDKMDGKADQSQVTASQIFGIVGIIFGIVGMVLHFV